MDITKQVRFGEPNRHLLFAARLPLAHVESLDFLGDRGAAIHDLHATRGATLIWNGAEDEVVAIPKMGSHRPYFITRPVALGLEQRLHFPNWTPDALEKLPETHILQWAPAHNVPMDKLYFTESREGGTSALGANFPSIPHDALNALPLERWEQEKHKYDYKSWLKAAKERLP